jgi:hypothetical protein
LRAQMKPNLNQLQAVRGLCIGTHRSARE